jgi:lipopolysaccharide export system protein LptC
MTHFGEKFIYILLASLALLSWWLAQYAGLTETSQKKGKPYSADYFSKGYTQWEMDENGRPKSKLTAVELKHYPIYWATHTKKPVMYFLTENKPPWIVEALTGILSKDGKRLNLNGKVRINRPEAEGFRQIIINTSNLKVKPETSYAETEAWAELISPPNVTIGIGMKAVFKEPIHLELLSQVKGKYEVNKKNN